MNSIQKLTEIFSKFPGIGPRQAHRFVYFLLTRGNGSLEELSKNISRLKDDVVNCIECKRFFEKKHAKSSVCSICADHTRDEGSLLLVLRDADLEVVERAGEFRGHYFVMGGSIPIMEKEPEKKIRIAELLKQIESRSKNGLKEIIIAFNWNPEGEYTADYVKKTIEPTTTNHGIKVSSLGKGLSMGTELEYADPDTLKNALRNRN
jgi:recombination protein RecR